MDFSELERELREKLPARIIHVDMEDKVAAYYDFYGVTFRESKEEQIFVDQYIVGIIVEKAGYSIKITEWGDSYNGHFTHYFEKVSDE